MKNKTKAITHMPLLINDITPDKKDLIYIENYKKLQLAIDSNSKAFVITPRLLKRIEKTFPSFEKTTSSYVGSNNHKDAWDKKDLSSILAKSLLEESTKYSTWISQRIAENTNGKSNPIVICDLCSGVGITSSKIYLESRNKGIKRITIHAIDNSIHAITMARMVFESQQIPYKICKNIKVLDSLGNNFNGVILIYADARSYFDEIDDKIIYDYIVSENGISYFTKNIHDNVLIKAKSHLNNKARILISALNPNLTLKLSKFFIIKEIIAGKDKSEKYKKRIEKGKAQYEVSEKGVIIKALTLEVGRQIEFMRYLLFNDILEFIRYMKGLGKATKAAMLLTGEIHTPTSESMNSIIDIFEIEKNSFCTFPQISGSPCDVIEVKFAK